MPGYVEIAQNGLMAMLMGLLIGLERERSRKEDEPLFAGIRTFPLITLTGFLAALVARAGYAWVLPVTLAAVAALTVAAYLASAAGPHKGATTEVVAILALLFGTLTGFGQVVPAAIFSVVTAIVLSVKAPLHELAVKIQSEEMFAILKFATVAVIVLPLLPDRGMGPWSVLNPRVVWWMVVLISAVSMIGYVLMRFLGARQGIAITGLLGGLASSTATTLGLSHRARESEGTGAGFFGLGIVLASTVMFVRVLILTWIVDPILGTKLAAPIAVPTVLALLAAFYFWRRKGEASSVAVRVKNPMELGSALKFGFIFAVVLLVSRGAHQYFGSTGLFVASALAGLTDVDAITVSTARLAHDGVLGAGTANAAILLASAMNTLVKGGLAVFLGGRALRAVMFPTFLLLCLASLAVCVYVAQG